MVFTRNEEISDVRNDAKSKLGLFNDSFSNVKVENKTKDDEEAKIRNLNFDRILHYEDYIGKDKEAVSESVAAETVVNSTASEEDTRPSSTTMQFGTADVQELFSDLKRGTAQEVKSTSGTKLKVFVAVYTVIITAILALIVMNTGLLARLKAVNVEKAQELSSLIGEYERVYEEYELVSSDENVINEATETYNMIKN